MRHIVAYSHHRGREDMGSSLINKLEELGLAEQGVVTPAQKMFAAMRLQGRSNTTNEFEGSMTGRGNAIPLAVTTISGTAGIRDYRKVLDELNPGDTLSLEHDRYDPAEPNRVLVSDPQGRQLGFLPKENCTMAASLLDAGKHLFAKVASIDEKQHWAEVSVTLFMLDE